MAGLTIDNPVTLEVAFESPNIIPGDTIVILDAGTYTDPPSPVWNGTQARPITIKANSGKRVVFDGYFGINNDWLVLYGIEMQYSGWESRESAFAGPSPSDILQKSANLRGGHNKFIGCIFHDMNEVTWFTGGGEMHDCLSYFHGWSAPDGKHGHAFYIHNGTMPDTIQKRMRNCIGFYCFDYGIHAYGFRKDQPLDNLVFEQCVMFGAGQLPEGGDSYNIHVGGEVGVSANNLVLDKCVSFNGNNVRIGYNGGVTNVILTNNLFDGLISTNAQIIEDSGNEYGSISDRVLVYPSEVIANRGNIIIYNAVAQSDSVVVDVSIILAPGDSYKLHNVVNFWEDIDIGIVGQDGTINVDMQASSHPGATPVALANSFSPFPSFGAFVIEKA